MLPWVCHILNVLNLFLIRILFFYRICRVVLAPYNIRRLDILENLTSVEHLKTILKERLEIKDDFLIQFEDPEFGN